MGDIPLPPVSDVERFKQELELVPASDREDAIQEAWLAHLDGKDALRAVWRFRRSELRHRKRQHATPFENDAIVDRIAENQSIVQTGNHRRGGGGNNCK